MLSRGAEPSPQGWRSPAETDSSKRVPEGGQQEPQSYTNSNDAKDVSDNGGLMEAAEEG